MTSFEALLPFLVTKSAYRFVILSSSGLQEVNWLRARALRCQQVGKAAAKVHHRFILLRFFCCPR